MPGRHCSSTDTQEFTYIAEEAPRGKHIRMKGRRRRLHPGGGVAKVAFAGIAAATLAGSVAYGVVANVGHRSDPATVASPELTSAVRTTDQAASRSTGWCGRTGPGQARAENYLQTQVARFGEVMVDARQDAVDCTAIKNFQTFYALPNVTGFADEQTGEVAARLARSSVAACRPSATATTVCIDLSDRTLWVMRGGQVVLTPTVIRTAGPPKRGSFAISAKQAAGYAEDFSAGTPLHAATGSLFSAAPAGAKDIALLVRDAKAVYSLTSVGSAVHVF